MAATSTKRAIAAGKLKRLIDPRIARALSHPLRQHILAVLNERVASPTEIGREIDLEVPAFYHHIEVLEGLGCIERVGTRKRRGVEEHFFRAKAVLFFDDRAWQALPATLQADFVASGLQAVFNDAIRALERGVFVGAATPHVSRLPGVFDETGWEEAKALLGEALTALMDIQERAGERIATATEPGVAATFALIGFETGSVVAD
jgi:DNA-binding transcriptional ArsR family regulator